MNEMFASTWRNFGTWIVLAAALTFFISLTAPVITWVNTDSDSAIYLYSARYLEPSHPTGAPAFNLLNAAALRVIPYGSLAWRLALLSALASSATAAILYAKTRNIIAPLVFLAAGLVVAQSTIIESYALITLLMVIMWFWRQNMTVFIIAGILGLGVHHLIGLTMLPILLARWRNHESLKPALWLFLGVLWYIYIPLTNRAPFDDVWLRGDGFLDYFNYMFSQAGLTLGLALFTSDGVIRYQDASVLLIAGFLGALIPIAVRSRNDLFTWVMWLPFLHYLFGLPHVAYVYAMPAFAFGGVMAAQGVEMIQEWTDRVELKRVVYALVVAPAILLIFFNAIAYNIGGENLDAENTAAAFYHELGEVEPDAVVWTYHRGWELVVIRLYNRDQRKEIDYVLRAHNDIEGAKIAIAQAHREKRLYHTVTTDGRTYGTSIERATPFEIWGNVVQQWYFLDDIPESARVRDWSIVGLDTSGALATP